MTAKGFPDFASNRPDLGQTVGEAVQQMLEAARETYRDSALAIATAYLDPGGFAALAAELERAPRVRLLLGAEHEPIAGQEQRLIRERDWAGFTLQADEEAQALVAWLRSRLPEGEGLRDRVEVRRYTRGFLHGKAYIAHAVHSAAAVAGSSNMTRAGLSHNAELNLGVSGGGQGAATRVVEWFEHYWEQSEPYDLAALYEERWQAHTPWQIYLRMLWELYREHFDEDEAAAPASRLGLTRFQADGVARMERLLDSLGGVLVADEVGLGKTFLAAEVIRRANEEHRQRVLVVAPAALRDSVWEPFLEQHGFARLTKVRSYEQIRDKLDAEKHGEAAVEEFVRELEDYALIVVDEAHNLRNVNAARSTALDRAITAGKHPKKVVLLTATPVNNSLRDLETLVKYFVRDDAQFLSIGIPSISEYIRAAQAIDPENLTPEHLFDLMDQVAVRRTRRFVQRHYRGDRITGPGGVELTVKFPDPSVHRIDYDLSPAGIELVEAMLYALGTDSDELAATYRNRSADPARLMLARYTSSGYLLGDHLDPTQRSNAGLLRSALLKRLESSPHALRSTLRTLESTHEAFLAALDRGWVLTGDALRDWVSADSDDLDAVLEALEAEHGGEDAMLAAGSFHLEELRHDVASDLALIRSLGALAARVCADTEPKAARLVAELERIALDARRADPHGRSATDRRKLIVFSTYSDTVSALHDAIVAAVDAAPEGSPLADYRGRISAPVMGAYKSVHDRGASGGVDQDARARMLAHFAPRTAGRLSDSGDPRSEDLYDLLITTDVLAEGVNLQQAGRIVNYDLPWNPMRIVQRHGRVDRIGSAHPTIELGLFFPSAMLDDMLGLEAALERKLAQADAAVGMGVVLPGRKGGPEVVLNDANVLEQFEQLLEDRGTGAALSGEEYRRRLTEAFSQDAALEAWLDALPFGVGSGFEHSGLERNVYVFCARIGDHPKPWFRLVEVDDEWEVLLDGAGKPRLSADTLRSLMAADPGTPATLRAMPDAAAAGAFAAWEAAQRDVHHAWSEGTDPASLMPDVPKAFRDAAALVSRAGHLSIEDRGSLRARLNVRPAPRVERAVRAALRDGATDRERIELVRAELDLAGIQGASNIEPLEPVRLDEVRLVAWMAVTGVRPRRSGRHGMLPEHDESAR